MTAPERNGPVPSHEDLRVRVDDVLRATDQMRTVAAAVATADPSAAPVHAGLLGFERLIDLGASVVIDINARDWEFGKYAGHDEEYWISACAQARAMWTAVDTMASAEATTPRPDLAAIVERTVSDQTRLLRSGRANVEFPDVATDDAAPREDRTWSGQGGTAYAAALPPQLDAWSALQRTCALMLVHLERLRVAWGYLQAAVVAFVAGLVFYVAFMVKETRLWIAERTAGERTRAQGEALVAYGKTLEIAAPVQAAAMVAKGWALVGEGDRIKFNAGFRHGRRLAAATAAIAAGYWSFRHVLGTFRTREAQLYSDLQPTFRATILEGAQWPDPVARL